MKRFVEIAGKIVHYNVQILLIPLVGKETILDAKGVRMIQCLQDLQLPILILFILEYAFYCHHFQGSFVSGLMNHSKRSVSYLIFKSITKCTCKSAGLFIFRLILAMEGKRGPFFMIEDAIDGCPVRMCERIFIFNFCIEFSAVLLKSDALDWFDFFQGECITVVIAFFLFLKRQSGLLRLIEADLFRILINLRTYPPHRLLLN